MNTTDLDRIILDMEEKLLGPVPSTQVIRHIIKTYEEAKREYEKLTEAQRRHRAVVQEVRAAERNY